MNTYAATNIGKVRKNNEDSIYLSGETEPVLAIVADGMGGHNAGDYASKYTVETIIKEISEAREDNPVTIIKNAIGIANEHIRQKAEADENLAGMGTTLVVATCMGNILQVANVGDSRLYVVNDRITQITRDHSLVEEMVRMGGIDRETARSHPDKNIITRAIGASETVKVDFFTVKLQKGDIVLMCSDGLTNMLEDEEIRMILNGQRDIVEKAEELVRAANNNGGNDNIAVVIIEPFAD